MLITAIIATFAAVSLLTYAAAMKADQRHSVRAAHARLADYEASVEQRDLALEEPIASRVFAPTGAFVLGLMKRILPPTYVEKVRRKLVRAGRAQTDDLDRFLVAQVLSVVAVPILWIVTWKFTSIRGEDLVAVFALVAVAGFVGPNAWLDRVIEERRLAIRRKLPDILDLLTISVEAGLGFEQALARAVQMVPGPLSEEFARMLGEMRAGASRADALKALDARTEIPELRSFVLALLQADVFGVSVGSILRNQAAEMRIRRHQYAQEQAQKAPVKMLFPMVFCIMPALFVVIAAPAFLSIFDVFRGR
jgi:tight adherence protein C